MTVAIDFDGVIHRYSKGWNGGTIYAPPVKGAVACLREIMEKEATFVFTARNSVQVAGMLERWGLPATVESAPRKFWNRKGVLLVTNLKLPARVYLDDRAVVFGEGGWAQAMVDLGFREKGKTAEGRVRELHAEGTWGTGTGGKSICGHCTDLMGRDFVEPAWFPCETIQALGG